MRYIVFISQLAFLSVFTAANEQLKKTRNHVQELEQDAIHSIATSVGSSSIYMEGEKSGISRNANDTEAPGKLSADAKVTLSKTPGGVKPRNLVKQLPPRAKPGVEEKSIDNSALRSPVLAVRPPGKSIAAANFGERPAAVYTEKKEKLFVAEKPAQRANANATVKTINLTKQKTAVAIPQQSVLTVERPNAVQPHPRPSPLSALPKASVGGEQSTGEKLLTVEKTALPAAHVRPRVKTPNMESRAVSEIAKPSLRSTAVQAAPAPSAERTKTSAQAVVPKPEPIIKPVLRTTAKELPAVVKPINSLPQEPAVFKEPLNVKPPPKFQAKAVPEAKQTARTAQNVIHPVPAKQVNRELAEIQPEKKPLRLASKGALPISQHNTERPALVHRRPVSVARPPAETVEAETKGKMETLSVSAAQRQAPFAFKQTVIKKRPIPATSISERSPAIASERKLVPHDTRVAIAEKPLALSLHGKISPNNNNRTTANEKVVPSMAERNARPHENRTPLAERPVVDTVQNKADLHEGSTAAYEKPATVTDMKVKTGFETRQRTLSKPSAAEEKRPAHKANTTMIESVAPTAKRLTAVHRNTVFNNTHATQTNKVDDANLETSVGEKAEVVNTKAVEQGSPTTVNDSKAGGRPPMRHIHTLPPGIEPPRVRNSHI